MAQQLDSLPEGRVESLYQTVKERAIGFAVRPGETLVVIGESGCGKSVTMKLLMRLQKDLPVILMSAQSTARTAIGAERER